MSSRKELPPDIVFGQERLELEEIEMLSELKSCIILKVVVCLLGLSIKGFKCWRILVVDQRLF